MPNENEVSDGIVKPLVPSQFSNAIFTTLQQLNQSQWLSPEVLALGQFSEVKKILSYAKTHSSFYRDRLADINPSLLTPQQFSSLPILTRAELQQQNENIDCDELPPGHGSKKETRTSGSTGTPVTVRNSGVDTLMWNALLMRDHLWHRRKTSGRIAAIRWRSSKEGMAPNALTYKDWGEPINLFYPCAESYYLNSSSNISDQLTWLKATKPDYLISHPSNLAALLAQKQSSKSLASIKQIHTVGESISDALRNSVKELTGTALVDFYSCQEVGYLALQCPDNEHYHVQSEHIYLEVVNEGGSPCVPGETGKVLLTALRNYATPLIRYEIGDYAEVGSPCPCGRGLPVLKRIHGRVRNMLTLPSGESRWPNFGFGKFIHIAPIKQFQVVQKSLNEISLRVVLIRRDEADDRIGSQLESYAGQLSDQQEDTIKSILTEHLGHDFAITIEYHQSLPTQNGKFEDFISEIANSN